MEISGVDSTNIIGTAAGVIIAAAFALRKLKPTWAKDDLAVKQAEADIGIIDRLERQNDRLATQIDALGVQVNKFQLEVLHLQTENNKLAVENGTLREENRHLREEIMELKTDVQNLTALVVKMQNLQCDDCEKKGLLDGTPDSATDQ